MVIGWVWTCKVRCCNCRFKMIIVCLLSSSKVEQCDNSKGQVSYFYCLYIEYVSCQLPYKLTCSYRYSPLGGASEQHAVQRRPCCLKIGRKTIIISLRQAFKRFTTIKSCFNNSVYFVIFTTFSSH